MTLSDLLQKSSSLHNHLCPRQVLGARMGLWAGELLALALPQPKKRLLAIVETDGCFADGVAVATNCWTGHRTLRVEDYGKVAATFVDTATDRAWRIAPHPEARSRAALYAPQATNRWEAMLQGYQVMPVNELLVAAPVVLRVAPEVLISRVGARAVCAECGEEIVNEREVVVAGRVLCRSCAEDGYYQPLAGSDASCCHAVTTESRLSAAVS
jgi:formylmethanofuran dehydrogenase subunit E